MPAWKLRNGGWSAFPLAFASRASGKALAARASRAGLEYCPLEWRAFSAAARYGSGAYDFRVAGYIQHI